MGRSNFRHLTGHPKAQISVLLLYPPSSPNNSGPRYTAVPLRSVLGDSSLDVPSEVVPKSAIFHRWWMYIIWTKAGFSIGTIEASRIIINTTIRQQFQAATGTTKVGCKYQGYLR